MINEKRQWKHLFTFFSASVLWSSMVAVWVYVWLHFYAQIIIRPFGYKGNWLVYMVYGVILLCLTLVYGGYHVGYYKQGDVLLSNVLSMLMANGITYLQTCLVGRALMNFVPIIWMCLADILLITLWSMVAFKLYFHLNPPYNMLVVYGTSQSADSLIEKMTGRAEKYNISRAVSIEVGLEEICALMHRYDSVIICDVPSVQRNKLLKYCFDYSIPTYLTPKISDIIVRGANDINLFDTPLLLCKNRGLTAEQQFFKRGLDLLVASMGILLTAPLMLLVAAAIKLQDGGAVLFRQKRCTLNNRVFEVYKFRSMIENAESDGKPHPAVEKDPRITPVGRIIRKARLDELPQLFNILKGDMSMVGPRPERIEHVERYTAEMPEFAFRSKVKAGLTGYAQVVGKYNTIPYDKLKLDLMYIENYTIFEDVKLILMTLKILFHKESTEGFEGGETRKSSDEAQKSPGSTSGEFK